MFSALSHFIFREAMAIVRASPNPWNAEIISKLFKMLKLEDFRVFKLQNISPIKGGAVTIRHTGWGTTDAGQTWHDFAEDEDGSRTACAVPDATTVENIPWQ